MSLLSANTNTSNLSDAVRLDLTDKDLFGRDDEIAKLRNVLTRVTAKQNTTTSNKKEVVQTAPELAIVSGASGTGKSTLVRAALQDYSTRDLEGFFICGKFDQFSATNSDPYSALVVALNDLCSLVGHHKNRDKLVESARQALGDEVGPLMSFIPGLRHLTGEEDAMRGGDSFLKDESEQESISYGRFETLCCVLIRCLATVDSPIVLFVDDLQWSDRHSLKLLRALLGGEQIQGLMIVGAYRDDEVDDDHFVSSTVKRILATETMVTKIILDCLDEHTLNSLIAFATELKLQETADFSRLIHRKTRGNCFFVVQFLEMLQDHRLLRFSFVAYRWEWDLDTVAAETQVSKNVVDIVVNRINKLDQKSQEVFKIAGCLGPQFTMEALNVISASMAMRESKSNDTNEVAVVFEPSKVAVDKLLGMHLLEPSKGDWIKFSHDRIQQAAEGWVLDKEEKLKFRLKIGRILKGHGATVASKNKEWLFFTSVDLLNKGSCFITDEDERMALAEVNRIAAKKAMKRSAFSPAARYNEAAISLLGKKSWLDDSALTMKLHDAAAECCIKCGKSERSFMLADEMIQHSSTMQQRIRGQSIQLEALEQQRRFDDSRELGLAMLRSLGEIFPRKPNKLHVVRGYLRAKRRLDKHTDEELLNLPVMENENEIMISEICFRLQRILFFAKNKDVLPLIWFRVIEKTIAYGMAPTTCLAVGLFGYLLGHLNDIKRSIRFGNLSLLIFEKFGHEEVLSATHLAYYFFGHHWSNPLQSSLDPLVNSYTVGMRIGEVQMGLTSGLSYTNVYFASGLHLDFLEKDLRKFIAVIEEYNLTVVLEQAIPIYQLVLNLTSSDEIVTNPIELTGSAMEETSFLVGLNETGSIYAEYLFHEMKLRALVFLGRELHEDVLDTHRMIRSKRFENELQSDCGSKQDDLYGALAAIALFKQSGKQWQLRYARRLMRQIESFVKLGAVNCVHMLQLLNAELMTCSSTKSSHFSEAAQLKIRRAFDTAINSATRSGFSQNAGLANELAAKYHSDFDPEYANLYRREAFERYLNWGAQQKLFQMAELYPCLKSRARSSTTSTGEYASTSGFVKARSRYDEDGARQHQSLSFW